MDGISRSRGWDTEILHSILPMKQLVLSDKWARKIESIIGFQWGQASFPTGTVGPRVGIFLEPLNTNDRFFFSYTSSSNRTVQYSIISVGDVTEVDVYSKVNDAR